MRALPPITLAFFLISAMLTPAAHPEQTGLTGLPPQSETLSLGQAIEYALDNNPDLLGSKSIIWINKSKVKSARSTLYPQANVRFIVPFVGRESGAFIDQLIWDFGRTHNRIKSRRAIHLASQYDHEAAISDTVFLIKDAYFNALARKHDLEAARVELKEKQIRLDQAVGFLELGRSTKIDVTNAEVELGTARLSMIEARNGMEINLIELTRLMGYKEKFDFELEDELMLEPVTMTADEALEMALASRPEIMSLVAQEDGRRASIKVSSGDFYPTIYARTAYRFDGEGATGPDFIGGAGVRFNIFNGFNTLASLREARARLSKTEADLEALRQDIKRDIKRLYLQLTYDLETMEVTETLKRSAEEKLELVSEKHRVGRSSDVELAEAESLLALNQAKHFRTIYDYKLTVARIERATVGSMK